MPLKPFLLLSILFLLACNGSKYTPLDYPDDAIYFGYTGGIANITTEYCLLENGNLFKKGMDKTFVSMKRINRQQSEQLFSNINFLDLRTMDLKDPGNKTNYLRLKNESGTSELAWGGNEVEPSKELMVYYSTLMNLVKNEN